MKIYGIVTPNTTKVLFTANELGLTYKFQLVDIFKGEQKSLDHKARNPFAKVPVLEHDGRLLRESNTICRYLANLHPNLMYPQDPWQRAQVDQWIDFNILHFAANVHRVFLEKKVLPGFTGRPINESAIAALKPQIEADAPIVNEHLLKNEFFAGDHLTIADTIALPMLLGAKAGGNDLAAWPAIHRWFETVRCRPTISSLISEFRLPIEL